MSTTHLHIMQPPPGTCALCEFERAERLQRERDEARDLSDRRGRQIVETMADRDQLRQRVADLEKLLSRWVSFGEFYGPAPAHSGPCGPESCCDGACMDAASAGELLSETRRTLDDVEAVRA